jgi:signal transduction histidine kinase
VARALDLLRPTAMKKAIRLQANLQSADHLHLGESGRLRQTLLNLLGNTVKFTATGCVTVSVQIRPDGALDQIGITSTDSGIGIAADRLRLR